MKIKTFAKISESDQLVKYPYTRMDLRNDNNNTKYDFNNLSIEEWYKLSNCSNDGSKLVEVIDRTDVELEYDYTIYEVFLMDIPEIDPKTKEWYISYKLKDRPESEKIRLQEERANADSIESEDD